MEPRPWWEFFLGKTPTNSYDTSNAVLMGQQVSIIANFMIGLREHENKHPSSKGFLKSLVPGGSFNDPDTFLWECRRGAF